MSIHLPLRLITIVGIIGIATVAKGDELFGVYHPAYIDSATGKGFSNSNVVWNLNSLAQDNQGRMFSILESELELVQVDPNALTVTPILPLNGLGSATTGLAFSRQGTLFAVGRAPEGLSEPDPLYRIDTTSGAVTVVGDTGIIGITDIAFSPKGILYGWSTSFGLITIDPQTARGTAVNPNGGHPSVDIQALTFGSDGTLYGARDALFKIDTVTGTPVKIGAGDYSDIRGLALIPSSPQPTIVSSGSNVILSWPTNYAAYVLQSTTNLASGIWTTNFPAPAIISGRNTVTNPISETQQFFRLSQ